MLAMENECAIEERMRKVNLVDGSADELAAEDDVREEDGEVALRLRVLGLFVQHVPGDGHEVRALGVGHVIHCYHSLLVEEEGDDGNIGRLKLGEVSLRGTRGTTQFIVCKRGKNK